MPKNTHRPCPAEMINARFKIKKLIGSDFLGEFESIVSRIPNKYLAFVSTLFLVTIQIRPPET